MDIEELKKWLEALAKKKTDVEKQRVQESWSQFKRLTEFYHLPLILETLMMFLEGYTDMDVMSDYEADVIRRYMEYNPMFEYTDYRVVDDDKIDPTKPDEENLTGLDGCTLDEPTSISPATLIEKFDDMLWMFGKLAKNISSIFLPRIIKLLADHAANRRRWDLEYTHEMAMSFSEELRECFNLVYTEISLMDAEELTESVWPKRPQHVEEKGELGELLLPEEDTAEETNASHREYARYIYHQKYADLIRSMPTMMDEVKQLIAAVEQRQLADIQKCKPNYQLLERMLATKLTLTYSCFFEDEHKRVVESDTATVEETAENGVKREIVGLLKQYLGKGNELAKEIGSKTMDGFLKCRRKLEENGGDFFGEDTKSNHKAERDLKHFMRDFRHLYEQLTMDLQNYMPPEPIIAKVDGVTKRGGKAIAKATSRPRKEKGFFSQKLLAKLFDVDRNTIGNWLHTKTAAPAGFFEAYEKKDERRMNAIAKLRTATQENKKAKRTAIHVPGAAEKVGDLRGEKEIEKIKLTP